MKVQQCSMRYIKRGNAIDIHDGVIKDCRMYAHLGDSVKGVLIGEFFIYLVAP